MLSNFRQLLLKKADGDQHLENLIKFVAEEYLADTLFEALEKMARNKNKERIASFPIDDFVTEMAPGREAEMLRSAIGHHVSRYKKALGSKHQDLANEHARQAFKLMNLASKAQPHSEGKLDIDYVDPKPWEASKLSDSTWTKGVGYKGKDFSFLQGPPSTSYKGPGGKNNPDKEPIYTKELARHGHLGAYPFEHVRVNGKYIPVDEDVQQNGYETHPFDHHPVVGSLDTWTAHRTPEDEEKYIAERDNYFKSHHLPAHFENEAKAKAKDPEGYANRGSEPAAPVHGEIPRAKLPFEEPAGGQAAVAPAPKAAANVDWSKISPALAAKLKKD